MGMEFVSKVLDLFVRRPLQILFRAFLPLTLTPFDERFGKKAELLNSESINKHFHGKRVLVVGGTKGIGASIVDTLRECGGDDVDVVSVGRSATSVSGGVTADLSTVPGCFKLVD